MDTAAELLTFEGAREAGRRWARNDASFTQLELLSKHDRSSSALRKVTGWRGSAMWRFKTDTEAAKFIGGALEVFAEVYAF